MTCQPLRYPELSLSVEYPLSKDQDISVLLKVNKEVAEKVDV